MTSSEEMHKEYVEQAAKNIDFVFVPASLKFDGKYCNVPELHWEQSMKQYPHDDPPCVRLSHRKFPCSF